MSAILKEHIDYLALQGRADAYAKAIAQTLREGDKVADLGCGVGVLGLACLRAGAAEVFGIDKSDAIEIARETMQREGLAGQYHCIRGSTFETELPDRVDLLVCDHLGWFGFDYGIIAMLRDAKARMLKECGAIMPRRMQLFVASTDSPEARALATAWGRDPVPGEYAWLEDYGLNSKHPFNFAPEKIASAPAMLGEVDLATDGPDDFRFTAKLTATRAHEMQGLAGWFASELAEGVWLSNSPVDTGAIKRNQVFLPCRKPIALLEGDSVEVALQFRFDSEMFGWKVRGPDGKRQNMSTFKSLVLGEADLGQAAK